VIRFDAAAVRGYYERHTRTFVAFGQGGAQGALHRAVWGPGVRTRAEAFRHIDDRIAALARGLLREGSPLRVVDLGCGVGGTLCYLAARLPIDATGLTLSPSQASLASRRALEEGVSDRVTFLAADFGDPPAALQEVDLACAIESFVHTPDARAFFARWAPRIRPGGLLVVCDDFLRPHAGGDEAAAAVEQFRRGWHVNTLVTGAELRALAAREGFEHAGTEDLSPYLELDRPRDRVAAALAAGVGRLPWRIARFDPWVGGCALQRCLRRGWIGYEFATFRRASRLRAAAE